MQVSFSPGHSGVHGAAAESAAELRLKVAEVFVSLQGEARDAGWPTLFIRLTGCPLRCIWCDSAYAFHGGAWRTVAELLDAAHEAGVRHVCVTGGEPLAQKRCLDLLQALCEQGFAVSLETSGAVPINGVDSRVSRVMDIKAPGSGESSRNLASNLAELTRHDQLKFVLADRADYEFAVARLREQRLDELCDVWFSPVHATLSPRQLADWIVQDRLPVRFQLQLHKELWGDVPGR